MSSPSGAWTVSIDGTDRMAWFTHLAVAGMAVASVLAAVGGLPFDLPMPTHAVGMVEPTCGMTRATMAILRGDLAIAWRFNPGAFAVVAFGIVGVVRWAIGAVSHRWINVSGGHRRLFLSVAVVLFAALWAYQQTHASFVIHARYP